MSANKTKSEKAVDALLATMPVPAREDFADAVFEAIRKEDAQIEALFKIVPVARQEAVFPRRRAVAIFFAVAAAAVILCVPAILRFGNVPEKKSAQLARQVAEAVANDPELYALALDEAEDAVSLPEAVAFSKILTQINPSTLEVFAYNE